MLLVTSGEGDSEAGGSFPSRSQASTVSEEEGWDWAREACKSLLQRWDKEMEVEGAALEWHKQTR